MSFSLKKKYSNTGGVSTVYPELLRPEGSATDLLNIQMYDNFGITKRRGEDTLFKYDNELEPNARGLLAISTSWGERLIVQAGSLSNAVMRILHDDVTVTFAGSFEVRIDIEMKRIDDSNMKFIVAYKDGVEVQRVSLGSFKGGLKDWATVVGEFNTGDIFISVPAARLGDEASMTPVFSSIVQSGDSFSIERLETVTAPALFGAWDDFGDYIERDGIIYFTAGGALLKYDQSRVYTAGMPHPTRFSYYDYAIDATASSVPAAGTYRYRVVLEFTDAQGNIVRSSPSDEFSLTTTNTDRISITPFSGALTAGGYYAAGVTATILRTKEIGAGGGSVFYVAASGVPLDAPWYDTIPDSALVENYTLPPFQFTGRTDAKYIDIWRNSIVLTGFAGEPDLVAFEDVENLEAFSVSNSFLTQSKLGGVNSGVKAQDNNIFIFKEESIFIVTGELVIGQFQVDKISEEGIGVVSNKSIVESGGRVWFLAKMGVYSIGKEGLKEESPQLTPIFEKEYTLNNIRNTVALNNVLDKSLWFCIPNGGPIGLPEGDVTTYVYNIPTSSWLIWKGLNFIGGIAITDKEIWGVGSSEEYLNRGTHYKVFPRTFTHVDFSDNGLPISAVWASNWEAMGEPSIPKKFVRVNIKSIDNSRGKFESPAFTLEVSTQHDFKYDKDISKGILKFFEETAVGDRVPVVSRRLRLLPRKADALRLKITHDINNENMLISGIELEIATPYSLKFRKE